VAGFEIRVVRADGVRRGIPRDYMIESGLKREMSEQLAADLRAAKP